MKRNNIQSIEILEGEEKEQGIEALFEKMMTENFPNLEREKTMQVQEEQRVPIQINLKWPTTRHITIKMPSFKDKEIILKRNKGETSSNIQRGSNKTSS